MNTKNIKQQLAILAQQQGFLGMRVSQPNLSQASHRLKQWLEMGYQGDMGYLERHQDLRAAPERLHANTVRVITFSHPYLTNPSFNFEQQLQTSEQGYISVYAQGRDYHKTLRQKLKGLGQQLESWIGPLHYRVFTDSAPVMEVEIATQSGLGWRGKNTLLLSREGGSWFFLGEIFTDLPLEVDEPVSDHCGHCQACLDICPTQAIIAPYVLDARRCISYLTIEHHGSIPEDLRKPMGNRIYGCDDCQMVCPWNRFAHYTEDPNFHPRLTPQNMDLSELFLLEESTFNQRFEGSAIRRIGIIKWLRNVAVALGNSRGGEKQRNALKQRLHHPSELVREHVNWALDQLSE